MRLSSVYGDVVAYLCDRLTASRHGESSDYEQSNLIADYRQFIRLSLLQLHLSNTCTTWLGPYEAADMRAVSASRTTS